VRQGSAEQTMICDTWMTWLKWGFLGLALGSVTVAAFLMWQAQQGQLKLSGKPVAGKTPRTHVDKPLIVEREAGHMVWRLKAVKAEQQLTGTMHLLGPELELFTESGKKIPMTGKEAWFKPLSKQVQFKGDVVVQYGAWYLYSDSVRYDHQKGAVMVPGPFRIEGKTTHVRGRNLTAWRATQHVRVEDGVWIEDTQPVQMKVMP